jgi:hypothetical protein
MNLVMIEKVDHLQPPYGQGLLEERIIDRTREWISRVHELPAPSVCFDQAILRQIIWVALFKDCAELSGASSELAQLASDNTLG